MKIDIIESTSKHVHIEDDGYWLRTSAKDNLETWMKEHPNVRIIDIEYKKSFWYGEQYIVKYE